MQATTMQRCPRTYIYSTHAILPSNRCWARTQGAAGRPLPCNGTLMHDSAQTQHSIPRHIKCETCGSTDSSSNLGSCGAVLSLQEARQQARLYHSMLYVPVSVQAALVQKGTWKTIEVARRKLSGTVTRWEALTVFVVAFGPRFHHAFCQPGRPCSCGEERMRMILECVIPTRRPGSRSGPPTGPQDACLSIREADGGARDGPAQPDKRSWAATDGEGRSLTSRAKGKKVQRVSVSSIEGVTPPAQNVSQSSPWSCQARAVDLQQPRRHMSLVGPGRTNTVLVITAKSPPGHPHARAAAWERLGRGPAATCFCCCSGIARFACPP